MGCTTSASHVAQSPIFDETYRLGNLLGSGSFGRALEVLPRHNNGAEQGPPLAAKCISLDAIRTEKQIIQDVSEEYRVWKLVGQHPNVVRIEALFIDRRPDVCMAYLVMERCGCNLRDCLHILQTNDDACRSALSGMLSALAHLHARQVVHRDVKLDNFLVSLEDEAVVKLVDFGLAAVLPAAGHLNTVTGTASYMAPELIAGKAYDCAVDVWSCGVCFYVMLYNDLPYRPPPSMVSPAAIKQAVVEGKAPSFASEDGRKIGLDARDLVGALLTRSASSRPLAKDALQWSYFQGADDSSTDMSRTTTLPSSFSRTFSRHSTWTGC